MTGSPDFSPVLDLIIQFRQSKTMFAAVEFGVFDKLYDNPQSAESLAASTGANSDALERLLDGCCGCGLLTRSDGIYSNTLVADAYLRRLSPSSMAGYILYSNRVLYPMWGHLEDAVRDGTNRWKQTFDVDGPIFSHFFQTDQAMATFLSGMHGLGLISSPTVVRLFNLNRFQHVVDLGGGTGHLAIAACERYGNMRATVFDLPRAVDHALPNIQASPAAGRIQIHAGDFFKDDLPPADLYAMCRILHDWSKDKIATILQKVYAALPPGGGLLVIESVLDDDRQNPVWTQMQSLNMLICTEGKERTAAEYTALFEDAGFAEVEVRRSGGPHDAILALKPAT